MCKRGIEEIGFQPLCLIFFFLSFNCKFFKKEKRKRKRKAQRRLSFWNVALKLEHMGTRLSIFRVCLCGLGGEICYVVDPTLGYPHKGIYP